MLAKNNTGVLVSADNEHEICQWQADGLRHLIGFTGTGTCPAEFRLYVGNDPDPWYAAQISPQVRTAYVADRGTKLPNGTTISLKVYHKSSGEQRFKGTILGG